MGNALLAEIFWLPLVNLYKTQILKNCRILEQQSIYQGSKKNEIYV